MISIDGLDTYQRNNLGHPRENNTSPFDEDAEQERTFMLRLLAATRNGSQTRAERKGAAPAAAFRILIIDSNYGLARGLSRLLRGRGHWVQYAHTGSVALKLARAFQPELVLIDASLPDISGYEIAALLPAIISSARLRIASVSGSHEKADICLSQAAGCISHLQKPVTISEVEALLPGRGASVHLRLS